MSGFEFIFTLFGLILGLALAEGLGGLARALKARRKVRIGWSTALLGLLISCDLITFWMYGWALREKLPTESWPFVFGGFVVTAIYFLAASLIFPDHPEEWEDLDGHFQQNYRLVLAGFVFCNLALMLTTTYLAGIAEPTSLRTIIIVWSLFPVASLAILTKRRGVVIACLLWLIALYPLSVIWHS